MFRTVPLFIIRSFSLYTQQWYMSHSLRAGWHIPLLCVQWKTPDDGQRNCSKHVESYSKYKFEKLMHLVSFIIRIFSRCTVTWRSKKYNIFLNFQSLLKLCCYIKLWNCLWHRAFLQKLVSSKAKNVLVCYGRRSSDTIVTKDPLYTLPWVWEFKSTSSHQTREAPFKHFCLPSDQSCMLLVVRCVM